MVAIKLIVLFLACVGAIAVPRQTPPGTRSTIFADERLEGEIFENIDAFSNIEQTRDASAYRLPKTTIPSHYNLLWVIEIGQNQRSYEGLVEITLHPTQANVSEIVIHADHMTIYSVRLQQGNTVIPTTHLQQTAYQFLRVQLTNGQNLQYNPQNPINYTLAIEFGAVMRTDMHGLYESWFRNAHTDAEVSWMASTQFAATYARYAFPCYDEPSFKATFNVTIRRPIGYNSWFSTRLQETKNTIFPNQEDDVYHTTPVMSTYLLAIIVAQYDSIRAPVTGDLMHEVIARPGAIQAGQGDYAMTIGQDLLAKMSEHTGYDFYDQSPNLKMTQAAIPDFEAGAMENWGLLTYREAYLMYDNEHTSGHYKQIIAYILAHEIAHMWFGNLVTNDWWDVIWLNEGFARYYQYYLTEFVEPDMGLGTRFINEQVHTSLLSDSANNPHPLTNTGVGSPAYVSAMFSVITYNKGAAIIRMTEHLLGHSVHQQGLRNYLRLHAFKTVQPVDLFNALDQAGKDANAFNAYGSNFNFVDYYKSWTEQPGHPVLDVVVNHATGLMTITQRRFNINTGYSNINTNYIIPITFTTGQNPNFENTKPTHIISHSVTTIDRGFTGDHWVLFNIQQIGFYRVNYDEYTWNLIALALRDPIKRELIHVNNRAQIVDDIFQFARSGIMSYERALNLLSFLESETAYGPWVAAMTGFTWLRNRLAGTDQLTPVNTRIVQWAAKVMGEIGYYTGQNESFMHSYLRFQLAPVLCAIGAPDCIAAAKAQFSALRGGFSVEVPADSRNWVYCNGYREGTTADYNFLWSRFREHNVYTEKLVLLQALGCTQNTFLLEAFLNMTVNSTFLIRPQDYNMAFNSAVSSNEENTQKVFTFVRNNLYAVIAAFRTPVTPLSYISARLRTNEEINAFQTWAFQNRETFGVNYTIIHEASEVTRRSIAWAAEVRDDINAYFVNPPQEISTSTSTSTTATTNTTTTMTPTTTTNTTEPPPITTTTKPPTTIDLTTTDPTTTDPTTTDPTTTDPTPTDPTSTDPTTTDPTTTSPTPPIPSAAVTTFVSIFVVAHAAIANIFL